MKRRIAFLFLAGLVSLVTLITHVSLHPQNTAQALEEELSIHEISTTSDNDIIPSNNTGNETLVIKKKARVLLVSALYPLSKSKHSQSDYDYWLSFFLSRITTEVYFYAPPALNGTIMASRPSNFPMTLNTTYSSIFSIPPLQGLERTYREMHKKDREQFRHSPELYAVWNSKPFFVNAAVIHLRESQAKEFDFVFWVDAGSFRGDHAYVDWPDSERLNSVWEEGVKRNGGDVGIEDTIFVPIYGLPKGKAKKWTEGMGPLDNEISEGSFFGGSPSAISWYTSTYYAYHSYYISLGHFVGKDQTIINSLFLLFPSRFITVWQRDPTAAAQRGLASLVDGFLGKCGAEWYYYEFFLSDFNTRQKMRELWLKDVTWPWKNWKWWLERKKCRLTNVMGMREALERAFGKDWKSPQSTVVGMSPT